MLSRSRLPGCRRGRACACGAQVRDAGRSCAKCLARGRWSRHKSQRGYRDTPA